MNKLELNFDNEIERVGILAYADELSITDPEKSEPIFDELNKGDYVKCKMMEVIQENNMLKQENTILAEELKDTVEKLNGLSK